MKRTVYTWMLTLLTVFGATVASADEKVSFEVKAPMVVAKGEAVRVEFSLNASPDEGSFTAPSFEGFDVIAGPAFSQGSSIQIVNGQMTRSSNYTITYVLLPQQEGNFTIGAASVRVGKSQYKTKALPIEVVEETPETTAASSRRSTASGHRRSSRTHSPSANATTARSTRRRSSRSICSTRSSRAN